MHATRSSLGERVVSLGSSGLALGIGHQLRERLRQFWFRNLAFDKHRIVARRVAMLTPCKPIAIRFKRSRCITFIL